MNTVDLFGLPIPPAPPVPRESLDKPDLTIRYTERRRIRRNEYVERQDGTRVKFKRTGAYLLERK